MRFLFVLDSVEAPAAPNPRFGRKLAEQLAALGHDVDILELWDGETPPPVADGCSQTPLTFPGVRQMNRALENGSKQGSPLPLRLLRLLAHPAAVDAAWHQFVLKKPRRMVDTLHAIECMDVERHYDCITAVCAPYRTAFALEQLHTTAKKALWQLDPYAANRDYNAPGGFAREAALLDAISASFVTPLALTDYEQGPLAPYREKIHVLGFPCLLPAADVNAADANANDGTSASSGHASVGGERDNESTKPLRCVYCGTLYPGLRTPDFALDLFSALQPTGWQLVMMGGGWQYFAPQAKAAKTAIASKNGQLQISGPVPPTQARAAQAGADVLLSIGNTADNQLPSKLFEYFGTGKPILHLAASEGDPSLPYLARYPLALVLRQCDGVTAATVDNLRGWLAEVAGKSLPYAQVAALYPEFTPEVVAQDFLSGIEDAKKTT